MANKRGTLTGAGTKARNQAAGARPAVGNKNIARGARRMAAPRGTSGQAAGFKRPGAAPPAGIGTKTPKRR